MTKTTMTAFIKVKLKKSDDPMNITNIEELQILKNHMSN